MPNYDEFDLDIQTTTGGNEGVVPAFATGWECGPTLERSICGTCYSYHQTLCIRC